MTSKPRRRLRADRRGNVAMIVALSVVPVVGTVGLAVDAGSALRRQERLQAAVDSGVLAGLKAMPDSTDAGVEAAANRYILTNFGDPDYTLTEVNIDRDASRVMIRARSDADTVFGGIFGISTMKVEAEAVAAGGGTIELVMALDNSGSMADAGRMPALREAATDLVHTLMDDSQLSGRVKIGIVPFSTAVNVGPQYSTANWIDRSNRSPFAAENFDRPNANRFTLFGQMGQTWSGCVEARTTQNNLDISDTAPNASDGRTLWTPMFAVDEPDFINYNGTNYGNYYRNNYLSDNGTCPNGQRDGSDQQRQARTCKYAGTSVSATARNYNGEKMGPNSKCESIPILALTDNRTAVTNKIASMVPEGSTNITEGASWGLRVLSSHAPFTEGFADGRTGNRKIMIVMTDGENTIYPVTYFTGKSLYSAYGYVSKARLTGRVTTDETELRTAMDNRLRAACTVAKNQGVEIYSIIVSVPSVAAQKVMEDCATQGGGKHAYSIATAGELGDTFDEIAKSIKQVRLAE